MLLQYKRVLSSEQKHTLCEESPYSEFVWSVFSRILTEYGEIRFISPHSVRMRENTDQKNSEYRHFSRSDTKHNNHKNVSKNGSFEALLRRFS